MSAGFFPVLGVKPLAGQPVMLDGATMAFTIGVTVCCGLLFGLAPAIQSVRSDPTAGFGAVSRGTSADGQVRLRGALHRTSTATV